MWILVLVLAPTRTWLVAEYQEGHTISVLSAEVSAFVIKTVWASDTSARSQFLHGANIKKQVLHQ